MPHSTICCNQKKGGGIYKFLAIMLIFGPIFIHFFTIFRYAGRIYLLITMPHSTLCCIQRGGVFFFLPFDYKSASFHPFFTKFGYVCRNCLLITMPHSSLFYINVDSICLLITMPHSTLYTMERGVFIHFMPFCS